MIADGFCSGFQRSFHTHEKLVRELSARTNSLVVFPEYSRSPEAKYPTAIEQCYFILSHIKEIVGECFPMSSDAALTVAGDSAGGNMAVTSAPAQWSFSPNASPSLRKTSA